MFKLTQSPTFWEQVRAEVVDEQGKRTEARFQMKFHRKTADELRELADQVVEQQLTDLHMLRALCADWEGVADDQGEVLAFSAKGLEQLFQYGFGPAILAAFRAGLPKARAKN